MLHTPHSEGTVYHSLYVTIDEMHTRSSLINPTMFYPSLHDQSHLDPPLMVYLKHSQNHTQSLPKPPLGGSNFEYLMEGIFGLDYTKFNVVEEFVIRNILG